MTPRQPSNPLAALARALIACIAVLIFASQSAGQAWEPSQQQRNGAQATVEAYLATTDRGDAAAAYAMHGEETRAMQPLADFTESVRAFTALAGKLVERRFAHVTWYKDPPDSPALGVYAAFDMIARYANIDRYCGYVMAYQDPKGGDFIIMRVEENYLDNATAQSMARQGTSPDAFWAEMASSHCPGWQPGQ